MSDLADKLAYTEEPQYGYISQYYDPYNDTALVDNSWLYLLGGYGLNKGKDILKNTINLYNRAKTAKETWNKRKYWGVPYRKASNNPQKAVETLKEKQQGFVPNADGNGVDFVWGEYIPPTKPGKKGGGYGLAHIEGRRNEQGYNGNKFLDSIPYLFNVGKKFRKKDHPGRYYIETDNQEAVIRTDYDKNPWEWLDSVYFKNKDK